VRMLLPIVLVAMVCYLLSAGTSLRHVGAAEGGTRSVSTRPVPDDTASLELKRQQLLEKEAALKAKEEAIRKFSAEVDAKVNELNAAKKGLEGALSAKRKQDDERYKKMTKIYKGLKAEEAATLLNKLDAKMVIEMLNQMDQKTVVKLIPFITQPRVLEWTRLNWGGE
jgi:flagellar protein FlbB